MLHEPTRRLGAEVDADHEEERRDERGAKLKAPGNITSVLDNDVGAKAQENT